LFIRSSLEAGGVEATQIQGGHRMKLHANAPLGPKGRALMVSRVQEEGHTLAEAAEAAGMSVRTAGKWVRRYRAEGELGPF
jgi:transposase-like protein